MTNTIKIKLIGNSWFAIFNCPLVRSSFGTDTIPTPFTIGTSLEKVVEHIQRLNPDSSVEA